MSQTLTPDQEEIVEEELLDLFTNLQEEIAADLGIKPSDGDTLWSDEDAERIRIEIDRRYKKNITDRFLSSPTTA